jgi:hypothetical protein
MPRWHGNNARPSCRRIVQHQSRSAPAVTSSLTRDTRWAFSAQPPAKVLGLVPLEVVRCLQLHSFAGSRANRFRPSAYVTNKLENAAPLTVIERERVGHFSTLRPVMSQKQSHPETDLLRRRRPLRPQIGARDRRYMRRRGIASQERPSHIKRRHALKPRYRVGTNHVL